MSGIFSQDLSPFHVARILGTSALEQLAHSHHVEKERAVFEEEVKNEPWEKSYATAGVAYSKLRGSEETLRRHLFPAAVLFQSSMEAKLMLAADQNKEMYAAIRNEKHFTKRWQAALGQVDQPVDEFDKYAEILYRGVRIPVAHLYDPTKSKEKLNKINAVSFVSVYTGVRYGWWAFTRLLYGLDLADNNLRRNWDTICDGVGLVPDLFTNSMPTATA